MNTDILIIEDNEYNLYLMRFLLEKNGLVVAEARSGLEGIQAAIHLKPSVILLDIQLPGMDGYSITEELRKNEVVDIIPIIAVTSYAMVGDKERILSAGANDYIEKPINPDSFVSQVLKHIHKGDKNE